MNTSRDRYKNTALCGVLIALAFILSYVESLFPPMIAIPGVKLGLTNITVLSAIYLLDKKDALIINFVRILLGYLLFGTFISFLFSLSGGMLSTIVMLLLVKRTKLKIITISVIGAISHNVGQIIIAVLMLHTTGVMWYFTALWFSGIATGIIIGLISGMVIKRCFKVTKDDHKHKILIKQESFSMVGKKFGIKEVVAIGIGTALFVALTQVQIPLGFIPNTALQPRAALLAFLAAVFGPIVGGVVGLLGHALGDAMFYGSIWWSWVFPDAVFGIIVGLFASKYKIKEGGFVDKLPIILFNVIQLAANAVAWIILAPVLDIAVYAEPANKVFAQGFFAFLGNVIIVLILGTLLGIGYSKIGAKSSSLSKED